MDEILKVDRAVLTFLELTCDELCISSLLAVPAGEVLLCAPVLAIVFRLGGVVEGADGHPELLSVGYFLHVSNVSPF